MLCLKRARGLATGDGQGFSGIRVNVVDWDGDGVLDLVYGVATPTRPADTVFLARNVGSNAEPVFEPPRPLRVSAPGSEAWLYKEVKQDRASPMCRQMRMTRMRTQQSLILAWRMALRRRFAMVAVALMVSAAGAASAAALTLHPKAERLPFQHQGPFVTTGDGSVLCIDAKHAHVSADEGESWTSYPLFKEPATYKVSNERALLRTRDGIVLAAWMNLDELRRPEGRRWGGDEEAFRQWVLPTYVCRSLDDGETWETPVKINTPWCGCIHSMIETRSGRIVLAAQEVIPAWRHASSTFVSDDKGKTWRQSNILDIGTGHHDHAGSIEGALVELVDGSLYQLLRTETGTLYEARSTNGGLTWEGFRSSGIPSVTCCAQLNRLADGRIALLWNHPVRHRPADRHSREELSLAFSDDECLSWSPPVVIAANYVRPEASKGRPRVSYPYLYERRPGEFWVTTMQGGLRMKIDQDVIVADDDVLQPAAIVVIGDSTAAVRPQDVGAVYADRIQDALRHGGSKLVVVNSAVSGDTTDSARSRFRQHVLDLEPKLVVLQFGMNDAAFDVWKNPPAEQTRVPIERFEDNLRWMVGQVRNAGAKAVLMTAAPVRWTATLRKLYGGPPYDVDEPRGFEQAGIVPFNLGVRELAAELGVPLVDVFALFEHHAEETGEPVDALLVTTGISAVNDRGHALIAAALLAVVRRELAPDG